MAIFPGELLAHWRQERGIRVGRLLCYAAFVLAVVVTVADIYWTNSLVVVSDLLLLAGAGLSLYWTRVKNPPYYYWWPLFLGGWINALASFITSGGLLSPFFGIALAALYLMGATLDSVHRPKRYLFFALAHIPVFYFIQLVAPLPVTATLPPVFIAIVNGLVLLAIGFCQIALLRTERELAEEFSVHYRKMTDAQAEAREAQSIAQIGTFEWDIEADRIWWSDSLYEMFEVPQEGFDPSYKAYLARLSPETRAYMQQLNKIAIETGEDYTIETKRILSKGERHFFSRGRPIRGENGKVVKFRGYCQDITDRKKIEAQLIDARQDLERRVEERTAQLEAAKQAAEHASQAKMQFLANMSHEIRTPMNSILGFSEILGSGSPTQEELKEFLMRIQANGERLMHLIDDILDLSKFEAGRIPVQKAAFDLRPFVEDVVASFGPALSERNLELNLVFAPEVPRRVATDAQRVSQVLSNLLSNAIKFSDAGEICLRVSGESKIEFDIQDCGVGISAANQGNLFQPFHQGDSSVARKFGGSGLGLALSRKIAEALGGTLELISSEPSQGSHFRFTVPTEPVRPEAAQAAKTLPKAEVPAGALTGKRILLAEDSPDNAFLISHFIKSAGGEIEVVTDGVQAVNAAGRDGYDFILMDIQMPDMDGLEATRRIRAAGFSKPIVALTAHALTSEAEKSLRAGCNAHLTKPISRDALINSVRDLSF